MEGDASDAHYNVRFVCGQFCNYIDNIDRNLGTPFCWWLFLLLLRLTILRRSLVLDLSVILFCLPWPNSFLPLALGSLFLLLRLGAIVVGGRLLFEVFVGLDVLHDPSSFDQLGQKFLILLGDPAPVVHHPNYFLRDPPFHN
jgi:hypothetical protein